MARAHPGGAQPRGTIGVAGASSTSTSIEGFNALVYRGRDTFYLYYIGLAHVILVTGVVAAMCAIFAKS